MASPQTEDGHLKIADSLLRAIVQTKLSATEYKVLLAIMSMTYRVGKTKAQIGTDDLRYATLLVRSQVERAIERLIQKNVLFRQPTSNGDPVMGIQKDWETWVVSIAPIELPPRGRQMTKPERFLIFLQKELVFQYTLGGYKRELAAAIQLYKIALDKLHEPAEAEAVVYDYFEDQADVWFRAKVSMPVTILIKGFSRYLRYLPQKPNSIKRDETYEHRRYRWDSKLNSWEPTDRKLP